MDSQSKGRFDSNLIDFAGPIWPFLIDDAVVEISLNGDGRIFVERFGDAAQHVGNMDSHMAERFVRYCANKGGAGHDAQQTIVSTRIFSMRHRLEAVLPPNAAATAFSIRRHRNEVSELEEFVPSEKHLADLKAAILGQKNILIAGGTGSGKTSFANACLTYLARVCPEQRCIVLEDTDELQTPMPNTLKLLSSERVNLDRLLVSTLRLGPKRIIVGEVRTGRVMTLLLKAWNTGHPGGITTIHANSAEAVISRVQLLCMEELAGGVDGLISSSLDLIVFLARGRAAPQVQQVLRVAMENQRLVTKETDDETK